MAMAQKLREVLEKPGVMHQMPCCYDALSAKMIEAAGFEVTFMSGFGVSSSRLAVPDTQLISYSEMLDTGRNICDATTIPVIGDADTGYGNAINVKRTVRGYAAAGFAGLMIEDQVAPKRCGHTPGKQVLGFDEACARIQAAVDARDELVASGHGDILIMARTDALALHGLDEAIRRMKAFEAIGADILFLEALRDESEMAAFCSASTKPKMVNLVENGKTPMLPPRQLEQLGFAICARPLTCILAAMTAINGALAAIKRGDEPDGLASFDDLKNLVGFPEYYEEEKRYAVPPGN